MLFWVFTREDQDFWNHNITALMGKRYRSPLIFLRAINIRPCGTYVNRLSIVSLYTNAPKKGPVHFKNSRPAVLHSIFWGVATVSVCFDYQDILTRRYF